MKKALFPCKCDPIHTGHLVQIKTLLNKGYDVTVDILTDENRKRVMSLWEVRYILRLFFNSRVHIRTHRISYSQHFPLELLKEYNVLVTGNTLLFDAVIGKIQVEFMPRYPGYRASKMRKMYEEET
jgi:phosphopantetheine adenylyltransferase